MAPKLEQNYRTDFVQIYTILFLYYFDLTSSLSINYFNSLLLRKSINFLVKFFIYSKRRIGYNHTVANDGVLIHKNLGCGWGSDIKIGVQGANYHTVVNMLTL